MAILKQLVRQYVKEAVEEILTEMGAFPLPKPAVPERKTITEPQRQPQRPKLKDSSLPSLEGPVRRVPSPVERQEEPVRKIPSPVERTPPNRAGPIARPTPIDMRRTVRSVPSPVERPENEIKRIPSPVERREEPVRKLPGWNMKRKSITDPPEYTNLYKVEE